MSEDRSRAIMTNDKVINEILHASITLELASGKPPEAALSMALESLFMSLAMRIKYLGIGNDSWFPLAFPMPMTMTGERLRWDFTINLKLENYFSLLGDEA